LPFAAANPSHTGKELNLYSASFFPLVADTAHINALNATNGICLANITKK
jgi:hypothetical protein